MSGAPKRFRARVETCDRTDYHVAHYRDETDGAVPLYCPGVGSKPQPSPQALAAADRLLADLRLLSHMADQDVRRFVGDLLEHCATQESYRPDGSHPAVGVALIRDMLRKVADGR
jgi:hypothetical protein